MAYRPTKWEDSFLKDVEGVVRFDWLDQPRGAPIAFDEERLTIGLNYWLGPSTVCKAAYVFDNKDDPLGVERDENEFFLQMAIGF